MKDKIIAIIVFVIFILLIFIIRGPKGWKPTPEDWQRAGAITAAPTGPQ